MTIEQTLKVSGHYSNLAKIADFIQDVASQAGFTDKSIYALQMAVDEACTNIIKHAYDGEGKGSITLKCSVKEKSLQVVILDQGIAFDPDRLPKFDPQAPLSERNRGGMGLFFIQNLVDGVQFKFNTPQGNKLILVKYRE